jgi:hypothetical protein
MEGSTGVRLHSNAMPPASEIRRRHFLHGPLVVADDQMAALGDARRSHAHHAKVQRYVPDDAMVQTIRCGHTGTGEKACALPQPAGDADLSPAFYFRRADAPIVEKSQRFNRPRCSSREKYFWRATRRASGRVKVVARRKTG